MRIDKPNLNKGIYDANNQIGLAGSILSSTGAGIAWTAAGTGSGTGTIGGSIADRQVAFGNGSNAISGAATFVYTGLGSVGIGTATPTQYLHVHGSTRLNGGIYDSSNSVGLAGSVLTSTGSGIAWTSIVELEMHVTGEGSENTLVKWTGASDPTTVVGDSSITDTGTQVTITNPLDVQGFTTSTGFWGPGTNITNLNADNLASGTIISARISGSYTGVTDVGTLNQLTVTGISTLGVTSFTSAVRDSSGSLGIAGSVLSSTGSGVAWTAAGTSSPSSITEGMIAARALGGL
jgi:hypothetical protein